MTEVDSMMLKGCNTLEEKIEWLISEYASLKKERDGQQFKAENNL